MKVLLNKNMGGFALSKKAIDILLGAGYKIGDEIKRNDVNLIRLIQSMGTENASNYISQIEIINIPDDITDWGIISCDGYENVVYVRDGILYLDSGKRLTYGYQEPETTKENKKRKK